MSRNRDGLREPTHISEAALWRFAVEVTCSFCAHAVTFEAAGLWWYFHRRGWDDHLGDAAKHMWCSNCSGAERRNRPLRLAFVRTKPQRILPPPPDEAWKDVMKRSMY